MNDKSRKYLSDIARASERILELTSGLKYDQYVVAGPVPLAVERLLITVGEAVNQLRNKYPADAAKLAADVRGIIAVRNILVHNYDDIDQAAVYAIITRHLPLLLKEVLALLPAAEWEDTK